MSDVTQEEARNVLVHAYGTPDTEQQAAVDDLADIHDGANAFMALLDKSTDDEWTLPEDIDDDTKQQLQTARKNIQQALNGLQETAAGRLTDSDADPTPIE